MYLYIYGTCIYVSIILRRVWFVDKREEAPGRGEKKKNLVDDCLAGCASYLIRSTTPHLVHSIPSQYGPQANANLTIPSIPSTLGLDHTAPQILPSSIS